MLGLLASTIIAVAQPDVYLLVVDTVRADHVGHYGYERATTPNLDAFAAGAVTYKRMIATAPWTPGSVGSIMTGLYPREHGVRSYNIQDGTERLRDDAPRLAEGMRKKGYRTFLLTENPWVGKSAGYAKGFDTALFGKSDRAAWRLDQLAQAWLESDSKPAFAMIHYMDVHGPYTRNAPLLDLGPMPERYVADLGAAADNIKNGTGMQGERRLERIVDAYDRGIRGWDLAFGKFFEWVKQRPGRDWCVVVASDHGEELFEHNSWEHGHAVWQEIMWVPMVVRCSTWTTPKTEDRLTSLRKIYDLVLALDGGKLPDITEPVVYGEIETDAGGGTVGEARTKAIVVRDHEVLMYAKGKYAGYDLRTDPGQKNPLEPNPALVELMKKWRSTATASAPSDKVKLDDATKENLRALGYLQ